MANYGAWEEVPGDGWEDVPVAAAAPAEIQPVRVEGPTLPQRVSAGVQKFDTLRRGLDGLLRTVPVVSEANRDVQLVQSLNKMRDKGAATIDKASERLPSSPRLLPEIQTWDPAYRALQANSDPRSLVGTVAKTAADPWTYVGGAAMKGLAPFAAPAAAMVGKVAGSVGKLPIPFTGANLGEIWNAGKNLRPVQAELAKIAGMPSEAALNKGINKGKSVVAKAGKTMVDEVKTGAKAAQDEALNSFTENRRIIEKRLQDVTRTEASDYKEAIKKTFQRVTKTYGEGINAAEAELAKSGTKLSRQEYAEQVIGRTLEDAEARGILADDPVLTGLRKLQNKLLKGTEDVVEESPIISASGAPITKVVTPAQENLSIQEMKNIKNEIYKELSGGIRSGTAAVSDTEDQVANIFLRNHGEYLGPKSEALAVLNKEAAPMYEARRWAYKNFRPYRAMEIDKGAKILGKVASGGKVNPDGVGFLKVLEKGSGRFQGTGTFTTKSSAIGKEIQLSSKTYDEARQRLIDAVDFRIAEIRNSINADVATIGSAGEDAVSALQRARSREVELTDMKKNLEDLRRIKIGLIGLAAGSTVFGKKALTVAKAVIAH